jgi:hypothetical protein
LFDKADHTADAMHKRPGFSEADLAPMFSALCRRSVTLVSFGFASSTIF